MEQGIAPRVEGVSGLWLNVPRTIFYGDAPQDIVNMLLTFLASGNKDVTVAAANAATSFIEVGALRPVMLFTARGRKRHSVGEGSVRARRGPWELGSLLGS